MDTARFYRRLLLVAAIGAAAWGLLVATTGGILFQAPWGRVSSRDATRPLAIAIIAGIVYYLRYRATSTADAGPTRIWSWVTPRGLAFVLSVAALGIGIGYGTFVAGGADSSGYISQAARWVHPPLTTAAPEWVRDAPWPDAEWTAVPLGYRPGAVPLTQVPTYAPGLPLLMAGFQLVGGPAAVHVVVPLLGALSVWMTYLIGRQLAGAWVGFIAAALMLASPAFLVMLVQPMSDVPVTAFWALAIYAAMRPGGASAAGAGLATALAVVTRPNLAPLAGVVALIVLSHRPRRLRDIAYFGVALAPAVLLIASINAQWYGSPLRSGYGTLEEIYGLDRIWPNLLFYGGLLLSTQTPLILLGLAAPLTYLSHARGANRWREPLTLALVAVIFPLAVLAHYLPYIVFDEWVYVRFLLPAYPALCAGAAVAIVSLTHRLTRPPMAVAVTVLLVSGMVLRGFGYSALPFTVEDSERRYTAAAAYAQRLPPRSVFMALLHSGSLRHYTGHEVLRWDLLDPRFLDVAVAHLEQKGHAVYLVADPGELERVRNRFPDSTTVAILDRTMPHIVDGVAIFSIP